jgi:predicted RNase H-related nuclease YkuK (DUF458 family)
MLSEKRIKDFNQNEVSYEDFLAELKRLNREGLDLYIGTDSQVLGDKISIVTCICLYKDSPSRNKIFYIKERVATERYPSLRARMLLEAYTSLEVALELDPISSGRLTVHLDIGDDLRRNKTARFQKELQVLFKSQGFECEIKPNSWASSCIADRFTKT